MEKPPTPITAVKVVPRTIPQNYKFVGVAESSHIVQLRARVEGYLEQIDYEEGGLVKKGDLMFVLDQRPFEAAVLEAKGELGRQEAVLWNAQQQKNRMVPLYEANAVSQKDYDQAISEELSAEADVITAKANLDKAKINLGFASIHSPVTGMATKSIFREGALISPGPDSLLTNIYVVDPIWVNFSVSQGDILQAREEMDKKELVMPKDNKFSINVIMPDNSVLPAKGKIDFTAPDLQQSTGTMLVRSILPNPNGWLKPGQFVRVEVVGAVRPDAITVPQTAVLQGRTGQFVYVVNEKSEAEVRPVTLGNWYKDDWVVFSGLKKGDAVVTKGVNKIQNGSPVEVTEWVSQEEDDDTAMHIVVYDLPVLH